MIIVHDIRPFIHLNTLGLFDAISQHNPKLVVTDVRMNNFGIGLKNQFSSYFNTLIEIDEVSYFDFMPYAEKNKAHFLGLGDGDKSSIFLAHQTNSIIITGDNLVANACELVGVEAIASNEFFRRYIFDEVALEFLNQIKTAS